MAHATDYKSRTKRKLVTKADIIAAIRKHLQREGWNELAIERYIEQHYRS